jgi:hypothetical protein
MGDLDWLVGARFRSLIRRDFDWAIEFQDAMNLTVGCLWRLIETGTIRYTSEDDGHQFGLPAPVDAANQVISRLTGAEVTEVQLRPGTLDLALKFSTGHVLEVIPVSSGYEAWRAGATIDWSSLLVAAD